MRGQVSNRIAAAIVTSTLIDYKLIDADNTSQIISKNKIQREISRCLDENQDLKIAEDAPITCILFDGRNDHTKVLLEDERGKKYPATKNEEHHDVRTWRGLRRSSLTKRKRRKDHRRLSPYFLCGTWN